jgi:two-component system cell cycle response regulator
MRDADTEPTGVNPGRVLVVDDSRLIRLLVGRYLRASGYIVEEAGNGTEAVGRLEQGHYDVVITDLWMPELDGFGVLTAVKRIAPTTEVIILTGTHDMNSAIRALRLGAHDYLTKPPTNADEVLLTVQRAVEKKRLQETNQRLLLELEALSRTDTLTGVANRRCFEEALSREVARARRYGDALSVVMLDIDHFKKVNDTHGHAAGDEVLRSFAQVVAGHLRGGDAVYRWGGEEFVVLLAHADLAAGREAAGRLVTAVAAMSVRIGSTVLRITTSAGVASLLPSDKGGTAFVARADAALYTAKKRGRNRIATGDRLAGTERSAPSAPPTARAV